MSESFQLNKQYSIRFIQGEGQKMDPWSLIWVVVFLFHIFDNFILFRQKHDIMVWNNTFVLFFWNFY